MTSSNTEIIHTRNVFYIPVMPTKNTCQTLETDPAIDTNSKSARNINKDTIMTEPDNPTLIMTKESYKKRTYQGKNQKKKPLNKCFCFRALICLSGFIKKCLSYLFFAHIKSFLSKETKERVSMHHLPEFSPTKDAYYEICSRLKRNYTYYQSKKPNYGFILNRFKRFECLFFVVATFKKELGISALLTICLVTFRNLINYFLGGTLSALLNGDALLSNMVPFLFFQSTCFFFDHHYYYFTFQLGLSIKLVVTNMLYEKMLTVDNNALNKEDDSGKFVNIISNDLDVLVGAITFIVSLLSAPVFLILSFYIMYSKIEISCIFGIIFMFLIFPAQNIVQKVKNYLNGRVKSITDRRLYLLGELLENLKTVKMFVWEPFYQKNIEFLRKKEVGTLRKIAICEAFNYSNYFSSVNIALLIILITTSFVNPLQTVDAFVFTILGLLLDYKNFVIYPFTNGVEAILDLSLLFTRIADLMELPDKKVSTAITVENFLMVETPRSRVRINEMRCAYTGLNETQLENININISSPGIYLLLGPSGSGKTTLLKAIIKEIPFIEGINECFGKIALVEQEPSLCDDTLQNNITFGMPFIKRKYDDIIKACCLSKDKLPTGQIGLKGVRLSGGQRARVALARALYSDADIYLLDDPLSAIDAKLTKAIFQNVFQIYLKEKIVLLVTHHVKYSKKAEGIIIMQAGKIVAQGDFETLKRKKVDLFKGAVIEKSKSKLETKEKIELLRKLSSNIGRKQSFNESIKSYAKIPRHSTFLAINEIYKKEEEILDILNKKHRQSIRKSFREKMIDSELIIEGDFGRNRSRTSIYGPGAFRFEQSSLQKSKIALVRGSSTKEPTPLIKNPSMLNDFPDDLSRINLTEEKETHLNNETNNKSVSSLKAVEDNLGPIPIIKYHDYSSQLKNKSPKKVSIVVTEDFERPFITLQKPLEKRLGSMGPKILDQNDKEVIDSEYGSNNQLSNSFEEDEEESVEKIEEEGDIYSLSSEESESEKLCTKCQANIDGESKALEDNEYEQDYAITWKSIKETIKTRFVYLYVPFLVIFYFAAELVGIYTFFTISKMVSEGINDFNSSDYFTILLILNGMYYSLVFLKSGLFFQFSASISKNTHATLLKEILSRKLRFFDLNSPGFILNNFSNDMHVISTTAPRWTIDFLDSLFLITGNLITMILFDWTILIPALILFYPLIFTKLGVSPAIRSSIKLETQYRFQLTNFITDTLSNLTSIRVFGQEKFFRRRLFNHIRLGFNSCCTFITMSRFLSFWIDLCTNIFSVLTIAIYIGFKNNDPEYLGIMIIYLININFNFSCTFESHLQMVNYLSSLQKIRTTLDQKGFNEEDHQYNSKIDKSWEPVGNIEFTNVTMRYDPTNMVQPPAVQKLSFKVGKGEHVGCVGKSGAGKSTIVLGLLRFIESDYILDDEGEESSIITLDGQDISEIEPRRLRKCFGIMPQAPFLMSTTIRENMDPYKEFQDKEIWDALEKVGMRSLIESFPNKLSQLLVNESNLLSTGQKQMINVARVLLKKAKIVIMDEATANIDIETDLQMQEVLARELPHSTFITIAHRIDTIIDCDKILVLHKGILEEFDHPFKLLVEKESDEKITKIDGQFSQLISALHEKDILFLAAKRSFEGENKINLKRNLYANLKKDLIAGK